MKKNLAIIGYGGQGAWHANWAQKSDVVSLAGIYDIAEKRVNAAKENGIHTYASFEEALADPKVDIVLCATPNDVHKEIVIRALEAGKNVVCEKPVALSVAAVGYGISETARFTDNGDCAVSEGNHLGKTARLAL